MEEVIVNTRAILQNDRMYTHLVMTPLHDTTPILLNHSVPSPFTLSSPLSISFLTLPTALSKLSILPLSSGLLIHLSYPYFKSAPGGGGT